MTNFEKVKKMSTRDLAHFLTKGSICDTCHYTTDTCHEECEEGVLQWLNTKTGADIIKAIRNIDLAISEVAWNYPHEYADAFREAKEALNKQVPKEPMHGFIDVLAPSYYGCGGCGAAMMKKDFDGRRFEFCPYCGQAIDWSKEK